MPKRINNLVVKKKDWLDKDWKRKFNLIRKHMKIPAFVKHIPGGYVMKFIDGVDLHGELFNDHICEPPILNEVQRKRVIKIFRDIVFAGDKTGYILADFTKKNIVLKGDTPYLVDYDVIIEEFNQDYIDIFQRMLDYLEVDYQFDGDLKKLYERLN